MPDVRLHPSADAEYLDAFQRYGANSAQAALGFERAAQDAIQKIVAMPQAYPAYDRRHRTFTLRKYPYDLVYREQAGDIEIVAFAHSARRPGYWKGR